MSKDMLNAFYNQEKRNEVHAPLLEISCVRVKCSHTTPAARTSLESLNNNVPHPYNGCVCYQRCRGWQVLRRGKKKGSFINSVLSQFYPISLALDDKFVWSCGRNIPQFKCDNRRRAIFKKK
ncbi:uncharacterized protein TM35_000052510 [Trypanosoma theileri]|uniref:Uncharacterized protein n=1 Tax=Trypanosoma theileri TaxID=67003 RepID=A0A1X0P459_9TRYP|nr:uncharacterized protein TM35_000052510 [Trypanosoma theileri]ORC91655.1 hypothetical protein TM35_000052510 [Trypanosoma theileri]